MLLNLKQLFEVVGDEKEFEFELNLDGLEMLGERPFSKPLKVEGNVRNEATVLKLAFVVDLYMTVACARCLKEVEVKDKYHFEHILVKKASEDNDEFIVCENSVLDLAELATNDLLLSIPTKVLCDENCKGLCMQCGCNLNEARCDCDTNNNANYKLSGLKSLLENS